MSNAGQQTTKNQAPQEDDFAQSYEKKHSRNQTSGLNKAQTTTGALKEATFIHAKNNHSSRNYANVPNVTATSVYGHKPSKPTKQLQAQTTHQQQMHLQQQLAAASSNSIGDIARSHERPATAADASRSKERTQSRNTHNH